jgi:hypothetical protein
MSALIRFLCEFSAQWFGLTPPQAWLAGTLLQTTTFLVIWWVLIVLPLKLWLWRSSVSRKLRKCVDFNIKTILIIAIFGPLFRLSIWPGFIISVFITRTVMGKNLGPFMKIPGFRKVRDYGMMLQWLHVACRRDYGVASEGKHSFTQVTDINKRVERIGNQTLNTIVLSAAFPTLTITLLLGVLLQPIYFLLSGHGIEDIPARLFTDITTNIVTYFAVVGSTTVTTIDTLFARGYGRPPGSDIEAVSAERMIAKARQREVGGRLGVLARMAFILALGIIGLCVHLVHVMNQGFAAIK